MPDLRTRRSFARVVFPMLCCLGVLVSCAKDPVRVDRNRPPQTFLVAAPAESAQASYRIHLYWRGEDPDGYIAGFLWSWDDSTVGAFRFTTKTDSIFELTVNDSAALVGGGQQPPGQTQAHTFYIRAVDNLGKADPRLTIFNRRIYNASTDKPSVRFVGAIPGPNTAVIDTLCDKEPFTICWTGSDTDGYVSYYRWDVGIFSSPLQTDTCVTFNDLSAPSSVPLVSGVYTVTVTAVDNAFARSDPGSGGRTLIVVNHDPDTWILGADSSTTSDPIGWYSAPFLNGQAQPPSKVAFSQGDTIPFRSTVWWNWIGRDKACEIDPGDPRNGISGYSAVLRGQRNGGDPYIIGFRDFLCVASNGDTIRFTSNDPERVLNSCGFQDLVLDSLDAGRNIVFNVAARDRSGRADGTPAAFSFSCNFAPQAKSFTVETITLPSGQLAKRFRWVGEDLEDGVTKGAELILDDQEKATTRNFEQELVIPESQFRLYSPENPHRAKLRVIDRAEYYSEETLEVEFNVTYPSP